jgi:AcrR family transcriptional regulator
MEIFRIVMARTRKKSSEGDSAPRLAREDWVRATYRTLAQQGWRAVKVEALAKHLGVTKGSFYWHFRDRNELLDAVLARWHEQLVIDRVEATGGTPAQKVRYMLDIVATANRSQRGGSLELAMRSWARQDERVARVVEQVDERRFDYTADLFHRMGFERREAEARAMLLFSYIFSQGLLSFSDDRATRDPLHGMCRALIEGSVPLAAE